MADELMGAKGNVGKKLAFTRPADRATVAGMATSSMENITDDCVGVRQRTKAVLRNAFSGNDFRTVGQGLTRPDG